jgi:CRISPR-associated exonuclease Cas4
MFGTSIPRGAVFHADSKRRREVEFSPALRERTLAAITALHSLLDSALRAPHSALPPAVYKPACEECSLFDICLPKVTENPARAERAASALFQT